MNKLKLSLSIKLAIIIMFISFIGIAILGFLSYYNANKIFKDNTIQDLYRSIEKYEKIVNNKIKSLKYDITLLSFDNAVLGFIRAYNDPYKYDKKTNKTYSQFKKEIKGLFNLMMKQNNSYFQIRIINAKTGNELIKLVKYKNQIKIIKENELQNKFNTDYVQNVLHKERDIYISDINLNREHNIIELPPKPTIRIAKSIKINNEKSAIVVINANINKLFEFNKLINSKYNTYIANQEGYYLLDTKEQFKEFGFEFGKNYRIYNDIKLLKPIFDLEKDSIIYSTNKKLLVAKKINISPEKFIVSAKTLNLNIFGGKSRDYILKLITYIIIITIFITFITSFIVKKFMQPIVELRKIANNIAKTKGEKEIPINIDSKDEIGDLAQSFKTMLSALINSKNEVKEFANKLEEEVEKKTQELQMLNQNLQKNVEEKIKELREKDQTLIQQSKMAAMGEMIGAIAHQWRQPLNALAINIQLLIDMAESDECDVDNVYDFVEKNMKTIQFMSKTIDDFRNFFKEDKEKIIFDIKQAIEATVELQYAQFKDTNINIEINLERYNVYGYRSEFMQVILNILTNSKDAIKEVQIKNEKFKGKIKIFNKIEEDKVIVVIKDNADGIPEDILNKIFQPYFTTKESGTGIGLYMSKEIMKNMDGEIEVINEDDGAKFMIKVPLWKE